MSHVEYVESLKNFRESLNNIVGIALEYPEFMETIQENKFILEFMGISTTFDFTAETVNAVRCLLDDHIEEMDFE